MLGELVKICLAINIKHATQKSSMTIVWVALMFMTNPLESRTYVPGLKYYIINGNELVTNLPGLVAICQNIYNDPSLDNDGVGVAIAPRWILTAAHVVERLRNFDQWYIIADQTNLMDEVPNENRFQIVETIVHEGFEADNVNHDIALIRVDRDLPTTMRYLGPFTFQGDLAPVRNNGHGVLDDDEVHFAGWGRTREVNDPDQPARAHTGNNYIDEVTEYQIILNRQEGDDTAIPFEADSGGPIYFNPDEFDQDQPVLVAIHTEGTTTRAENVRVDVHARWIFQHTRQGPIVIQTTDDNQTDDEVNEPEENLLNQAIVATGIGATAVINAVAIGNGAAPDLQNRQVEIQPPAHEEEVEPLINNHEPTVEQPEGLRWRGRRAQNIEVLDNCGK